MDEITLTLNGSPVSGRQGMTILELARENGIEIPTLCYVEGFPPTGACRVCVVEVAGLRTLVASCHTPITQGMVISTHSPRVLETRKVIVELLLANHCGSCFLCEKANLCEIRKKRYYPIEDVSPYIKRDMSKCILCRRCVLACNEIAKQNVFGIAYRGFRSKIVVDCDQPIDKEVCRDCGICIPLCPTGALSKPVDVREEKKGQPLVIKG
ncbi:MAG: (2Fe-2S)-binding protein [Chloroflexi bacterium]|nr:(2Fe-2S)-binding protein [Chloroflexota bacterium]